MLALVVVVDRRLARVRGDLLKRSTARPGPLARRRRRANTRAHPAHQALRAQVAVGRDDVFLGGATACAMRAKVAARAEVTLPLVEQAEAGGVERRGGMAWRIESRWRAARVVKKMPLLADSKPPIGCFAGGVVDHDLVVVARRQPDLVAPENSMQDAAARLQVSVTRRRCR